MTPEGEEGTVRFPWEVFGSRAAIRNAQGVWIRSDNMTWFLAHSPELARSFRPKAES